MSKRDIKLLIAIFIILIIILSIIIVILKLKSNDNNGVNQILDNIGDPGEEIDYSTSEVEYVIEKIDYYNVVNCINKYLSSLNEESTTYYNDNERNGELQQEYIYNILSQEYIKKNNINKENILNYIDTYKENRIFLPLQMKVLEKENIKKFIAYGVVENIDNQYIKDMYIFVNLDYKNKTYSIEPINELKQNIEEIEIVNENIQINQNTYNKYIEPNVNYQYTAKQYFSLYKTLALSKPEYAYNMLSDEYKEKRFGSFNKFQEYINNNRDEISKVNLSQYLVNNYNDYNEYVGKDQFGNLYIFNDYYYKGKVEIKLDTYTIAPDEFKTTYEDAEESKKVQMNIDKFIQMINRHDYISSYECISDGFKSNYFNSQEAFEQYIKNTFFTYNKFEFINFEKRGSNIFTYNVQITDLTGVSTDIKSIDIIMKLNDDLDFEMSFGV